MPDNDLQDLLNYVKTNAIDVADLISVADIERLDRANPYRKILIRGIRSRYEDGYEESRRATIFEE